MTGAAIHGEISNDGRTLILIAAGDDWAVAAAAKALRHLTPLFSKSDPPGALTVPLTWPAVVQLGATFTGNGAGTWVPGPKLAAWTAEEIRRRTQAPAAGLSVPPPPGMVPRGYQIEAARVIAATGKTLILDDPGVGKTMESILGLLERQEELGEPVTPVLVICPASVIDPWLDEFAAWAPAWRAVAWHGDKRLRHRGKADVYVTSYETARNDAKDSRGPLVKLGAAAVIVDELHLIANPHARRSQAVARIARRAATGIALSGTSIKKNTGDLWMIMDALWPGAWPSKERWVKRYCKTHQADYQEEIEGLNLANEAELRIALLGQIRRVSKADVLAQLPPKVYSTRTVELPPAWRRAYDEMEAQMLAELPDDGGELSVMEVLTQMGVLARMASCAFDAEITWEPDRETGEMKRHIHTTLKEPCWKSDALLEILDERRGAAPVLAFAPSRQLIMIAGRAAEKEGHRVGYVAGGQSKAERTAAVAAFQAGELDLLAATTGAGGTGLTLTAAGTVAFLQRPWALTESIQAEDRAHRYGSEIHESIEIIDIIAKRTVDSRIRAALRDKAGQLAEWVRDPRVVRELLGGLK